MKVMIALQDSKSVEALITFILNYPWPVASTFLVVHVVAPVQVNSYMSFLPSGLTEEVAIERRSAGDRLVHDFAKKLREEWKSPHIEEKVIEGDAKIEISELIEDWSPDIVVLGSNKKTGLKSLGSVSQAISASSPTSVLIVPVV